MYFYSAMKATTSSGEKVKIPVRSFEDMKYLSQWIIVACDLSLTGNTEQWSGDWVDYNVRDRLIADF